MKDFDNDCEGGVVLNADLETLDSMYGQDHIKLEISFPDDYPTKPFFIRVITPRCMMYTGHVTAGGSARCSRTAAPPTAGSHPSRGSCLRSSSTIYTRRACGSTRSREEGRQGLCAFLKITSTTLFANCFANINVVCFNVVDVVCIQRSS